MSRRFPRAAAVALLLACSRAVPTFAANDSGIPLMVTPAADRRGVEQTFLTFPEWFLVFSPAEYADFVQTGTPDQFVFWGHIRQFWQSYAAVAAETRHRHDTPNPGYHVMIVVIGVSTTVEYAIRSAYETLIGRITAATAGGQQSDEDRYGARVAQEYVDFIRVRPWYEFDFWARLKGLWSTVPAGGAHPLRKWERRYALTTEYLVKTLYGKLIEKATHSAYDVPKDFTAVVLDEAPCTTSDVTPSSEPSTPRGPSTPEPPTPSMSPPGGAVAQPFIMLPRYQAFTPASIALAKCGARFREIAGNSTVILVSAVGATTAPARPEARELFTLPILTRPGLERRAYVVPVAQLGTFLNGAGGIGLTIEHVFDY